MPETDGLIEVENVKREARQTIAAWGEIPLRTLTESLGCQCGRPRQEVVSRALAHMLTSGEARLGSDRHVSLAPGASS